MSLEGLPRRLSELTSNGYGDSSKTKAQGSLSVALVNNMPDAALQATERQFCGLLSDASVGLVVHLKFYSLPGIKRSEFAQAHIDSFYEDFRSLAHEPPDALIMTGTEPQAACLRDEAYWQPMASVINLCHDLSIPAIWSCLAAHAAVLEIDGIPRVRLPRKLFDVCESRIGSTKHQIFYRMPEKWAIPHSRFNTLRPVDLQRSGYDIVSQSAKAGVDIFIKRYDGIQIFLQGHPEYESGTLSAEFRRDALRAFRGQRDSMPIPPASLGYKTRRALARKLKAGFANGGEPELLALIDSVAADLEPKQPWAPHARRMFENWLSYVDARKRRVSTNLAVMA